MTLHDVDLPPRRTLRSLAFAALALLVAAPGFANDWPQWRGEDRRGEWTETGIVEALPDELKVAWRVPINSGYSGAAVADGRVFITDWAEDPESRTVDGTERALALDEETGEVLWVQEWPTTYRMLMFSYAIGPRATPTVDGDRVYVVGAAGDLYCLDVETGDVPVGEALHRRLRQLHPHLGGGQLAHRRRRPADHGGRRRAGRPRDGVGQADRRGDLARPRRRRRDGLRPAHHHRGGAAPGSSSSGTRRRWCR